LTGSPSLTAGDVGLGASEKIWDPLIIFAAVEASDFKFGILGFNE